LAAGSTSKNIRIAEKEKTIIVDSETLEATQGIFAGGDVVSGAASVIKAIEAGKRATQSMNNFLLNRKIGITDSVGNVLTLKTEEK